jgi:predicted ATP-grasp superfamily ATP-dependent carboligase
MTAKEMLEQADVLRRNCRFGDAINLYSVVVESEDVTDEIRKIALTSIELIQEINGFVNVDLMNP